MTAPKHADEHRPSAASLLHGGWAWRPQLQEWHRLTWIASTRPSRGRTVTYIPTLLRRNADRRLIKALSRGALKKFNQDYGFTYGEEG